MKMPDGELLNGLALAYIGDGAYELAVRNYVLSKGYTKPNQLHRAATAFVSAKAQAASMEALLTKEGFLTEKEIQMFKRGRNANSHTSAKNADILTYRISTGFEAMLGYLYLSGQEDRLQEIIAFCIEEREVAHETKP